MSLLKQLAGAFSPSFRRREKFQSMLTHPHAYFLYDDFLAVCGMEEATGGDGSETIALMITWTKSLFGPSICSNIEDLRNLLIQGGCEIAVNERMVVQPALFDAIAIATYDVPRLRPGISQSMEEAAARLGARRR